MSTPTMKVPVYFAPDKHPSWNVNPGVLTAVSDMYPTKRGTLRAYGGSSSPIGNFTEDPITFPTTSGTALYGRAMRDHLGAARIILGTTKRLYVNVGNLWGDISLGGIDYTTASDWTFTTWGSSYIACSKENYPQTSTSGGTFANLTTALKARLCVTQKDFLLLADYNDGTDTPDGVAWSQLGNIASFSTSINNLATEAGYNRLRDTPGTIRAFEPLRDAVVAYKDDSIYLGQYTGRSPHFWEWQCVSHAVGASARHGIAKIGDAHYFLNALGLWRFDGSSLQMLSSDAARYLKTGGYKLDTIHAAVDEQEGLIIWYLKTSSTTTAAFSAGLAFNIHSGKLGWIATPWTTNSPTAVIWGTYSDFGGSGVTAPTTSQMAIMLAYSTTRLGTDVTYFQYVDILGTSSSITTGFIGVESSYVQSLRCIPHCLSLTSLSSGTDANSSRMYSSATSTTMEEDNERWDWYVSNRYHKLTLPMVGAEIEGLELEGLGASRD